MIKILTFISFFITSISKHINNDQLDNSINYNIPGIFDCPERECDVFCENGHKKDENGCNICDCNPSNRLLGDDNTLTNECSQIPYIDCDSQYVCPKVTEITHCSEGGISGYTTYQLSLIIKNPIVKNIYAIYGDNSPIEYPLSIPPAYQGNSIFNNNIGGISPELITINPDASYDSWLTIGITNGDPLNKISTIGIDFNSWNENTQIYTTNGAVFVMDPNEITGSQNEYIIAQLTLPNDIITDAIVNVQGKFKCESCRNSWKQNQIHFHLEPPHRINTNLIPSNCITWYDGCNICNVLNGQLNDCSQIMCLEDNEPYCLNFDNSGH